MKLDEEKVKREERERADAEEAATIANATAKNEKEKEKRGTSKDGDNSSIVNNDNDNNDSKTDSDKIIKKENSVEIIKNKIKSSVSRRFGRLAEVHARYEIETGTGALDAVEMKLVGTGVKAPENNDDDGGGDDNLSKVDKGAKCNLEVMNEEMEGEDGKGKKKDNSSENDRDENDDCNEDDDIAVIDSEGIICTENKRLGLAAAEHLEKMGREFLLSDAPGKRFNRLTAQQESK